MGDRYILQLRCAKCGVVDNDVYYAPTCGFTDFKCQACGTVNDIIEDFTTSVQDPELKKLEEEIEEGEYD